MDAFGTCLVGIVHGLIHESMMPMALSVKKKCQDVANHQPFGEGQGQVLVLAEAKTLPHPFVEGLVPGDGFCDRASGFGFATHASKAGNRWLDHLYAQEGPQLSRGATEGWW